MGEDKDDKFDLDTTPHRTTTLEHLRRIEVQSLSLVVYEMSKGKEQGHMITFASDSTTRREVGKFIGEGIHIGQSAALPLPLLPLSSETRDDIALQLGMGLELLAISSNTKVEDLAAMVDTLITAGWDNNGKPENQVATKSLPSSEISGKNPAVINIYVNLIN